MAKQKFHFRIQPQGLSVKCTSSFLADVNKLPLLYLSVQKGSHSASTTSVQLTPSRYKSTCFSASWKSHDEENMVDMTLPLARRSSGKGYESKEVKVSVKFEEADTGKQQCLASCRFDVTTLHLDKKKSERKVLELVPSRTAGNAFKSVSVVMTIAHELADASATALDSGSERSGSVSPQNYPTESFIHGMQVGAVGPKITSNGCTENGQIHQKQQPMIKQQVQATSQQDHSIGKQDQLPGKHEQVTGKQELASKQITKEQQKINAQEEANKQLLSRQEQLHQTVEISKQKKMAEGEQQQSIVGDHSKHNSVDDNDVGPTPSSVIEPMESDRTNHTMDAWQSEKVQQDVTHKSKLVENGIKPYTEDRIDGVTSPMSSESIALTACVSDENLDSMLDEDDKLEELSNYSSLRSASRDLNKLTPRKRAISVDVLSAADAGKIPVYFAQEHPFQARHRSQTVLNEPKRKAPSIPAEKSPSIQSKRSVSSHSSLGDLRRPVRSSVATTSGSNSSGMAYYGKFDILGVLRVKLRGISIPEHTGELMEVPPSSNVKALGRAMSVGALSVPEATHGIYCVFTINGGNTSAKSNTCKVLPYRPVLWEEGEKEKLFFTNHSRQLFILCRKVPLKKNGKAARSQEVCVGASVMKIIEIKPTLPQEKIVNFTSTKGLEWYNKSLPLQPKGEIELSVCFEGLTPRYKVTCQGVVTVMKVNGIDCQRDVDLSCTVKLDSEMLDSTNVYTVEECAVDGWYDEPIEFKARKCLDLVVQIWAYSDDGTASWCGLSMLPLATILHEHDMHKAWAMTPTGGKEREVFVYNENERTITCPIEPQGTIELKVKVSPDKKIKSQEFLPIEVSSSHTPVPAIAKITSISTAATAAPTNTVTSTATVAANTVTTAATTTATSSNNKSITTIATNITATAHAIATNNVTANSVVPSATTTTATATTAAAVTTSSSTGKPTSVAVITTAIASVATAAASVATTKSTTASLTTTSDNKKQEDAQDLSEMDNDTGTPTLKRQGTLRRKFNIHRGKQQDAEKSSEPQVRSVDELRQENIDLKREVEYLREQLRMVKAKLADSEFHKEKAEAELRTIKHKEDKKRTRIFSFGRKS